MGFRAGSRHTTTGYDNDIESARRSQMRMASNDTATSASIFGANRLPVDVAVSCNSQGKLGTITSSERFKDDIKPMDKASEAILALKPVTFRYKKEIDPRAPRSLALSPRKWKR